MIQLLKSKQHIAEWWILKEGIKEKNISFVLELHENEKKQPQQSLWGALKEVLWRQSKALSSHIRK